MNSTESSIQRDKEILIEINVNIGTSESTADHDFFEALLAPSFAMVRPDGTSFDDRQSFLQALSAGPSRHTIVDDVTIFDDRAIVVCTVWKGLAEQELGGCPAGVHRNIRALTRSGPGSPWQLIGWLTEPLLASALTPPQPN